MFSRFWDEDTMFSDEEFLDFKPNVREKNPFFFFLIGLVSVWAEADDLIDLLLIFVIYNIKINIHIWILRGK